MSVKAEIVERVVAVVNEDVITQSELDDLLRPVYSQFQTVYKGEDLMNKLSQARLDLLNQLIEDKLIYQEAQEKGVTVSEEEINAQIDRFKKRFKSEAEFKSVVSQQGLNINKLKEKYRQQIAVRKLNYFEVKNRVIISPKEIREYYEENLEQFEKDDQVKLLGITIRKSVSKDKTEDKEAKVKADQILANLKRGSDFETIATTQSEDFQASTGGDYGFVSRGELASEIDEIIFALKTSQLSPVIETEVGFHVFKVVEKLAKEKKSLEDVRKNIRDAIYRDKARKRFQEWVNELKVKAYISIR